MKAFLGLFAVIALLVTSGCVVGPPAPAGVSVGVYGEYPYDYYGHGYYHPYYHHYYRYGYYPYRRDHFWERGHYRY